MSTAIFSQTEVSELSLSANRRDEEIVVSAWVRNPAQGPAFTITDLLAPEAPERELLSDLRMELGRLPETSHTALWGVTLPPGSGAIPASFTISVMLGPAPEPDAAMPDGRIDGDEDAWEGVQITDFALAGHAGQRRARLMDAPTGRGRSVKLLTATYAASTRHGLLTVAFGTPHVDFGEMFMTLFDRVASGVRVVSAQSAAFA